MKFKNKIDYHIDKNINKRSEQLKTTNKPLCFFQWRLNSGYEPYFEPVVENDENGEVVRAGIYGAYSVSKKIFFVQGIPALLGILSLYFYSNKFLNQNLQLNYSTS